MRIEDKISLTLKKTEQSEQAKAKKSDSSVRQKSAESDSISISSGAKEAVAISKKLKAASDIRVELVNEIRSKIENGTYEVSGKQVAEKVVNAAIDDIF
jgi:negative regulator of flagellin synthesis FlgM